jgi:cytochrome c peroxidase
MIGGILAAWAMIAALGSQDGVETPVRFDERTLAKILTHSPLEALPRNPTNAHADDPLAARLGQLLFFEKRLSRDGDIACATCHDPTKAFTDGKPLSEGLERGNRHTTSLLNVAYQRWLFWDGRADSLWAQARHPIESRAEMGGDRRRLASLVRGDAELLATYEGVFGPLPEAGSADAAERILAWTGKALEAYERLLVSRDSAFDRFAQALRAGDEEAQAKYPQAAQRGLALFVDKANCRLCHAGPNFSDEEFHNIGVPPLDGSPARDSARYGAIEELQKDVFNAAGRHSDDPGGPRARELGMLARTSELWGHNIFTII